MKNKKTIMAFSAILILIFHLWINLTDSTVEMYLRQLCVIGVDLFFFVSAYTITKQEPFVYKNFIKDRFERVYLKFIVLSIIAAFIYKWELLKTLKVILGIEFFIKGGGSFLWFIPAIMIVYLILPLYKKLDYKYPKLVSIITLSLFFIIAISVSKSTSYKSFFILFNRIPIILLGYYFNKYHIIEYLKNSNIKYWSVTITTLIIGIFISYVVYIKHFKVSWFVDCFYILYIPLIISMLLLLEQINVNKLSKVISSITLELYGIQMIFGYKIADIVFKYTTNNLVTNILVILIICGISLFINKIFDLTKDSISKAKTV